MEPNEREEGGKTVGKLNSARLNNLADMVRALPAARRELLMDTLQKQVFSIAEAAALLSCHRETVRRAIRKGDLKASRVGRDYRISRIDLETYWSERGGAKLFDE